MKGMYPYPKPLYWLRSYANKLKKIDTTNYLIKVRMPRAAEENELVAQAVFLEIYQSLIREMTQINVNCQTGQQITSTE